MQESMWQRELALAVNNAVASQRDALIARVAAMERAIVSLGPVCCLSCKSEHGPGFCGLCVGSGNYAGYEFDETKFPKGNAGERRADTMPTLN